MQKPAAHCLGRKGREPCPLEARIIKPQLGVSGVDRAVTLYRVRNQLTIRCDNVFGLTLVNPPQALASKYGNLDDFCHHTVEPFPLAFALGKGLDTLVELFLVDIGVSEMLGHAVGPE